MNAAASISNTDPFLLSSDGNEAGRRRLRRPRKVVSFLATTSHPAAAATSNATGSCGALTLICPRSGTIVSSTRIQGADLHSSTNTGKGQVGVSNISLFPNRNGEVTSSALSSLAIAYGASTDKNDTYGMLVSIRRAPAAAPMLHWKCRLPEPIMSGGLLVSPVTSRHVVGGGSSGTLYVWDVLQGGSLIQTITAAHYRAVTCMKWSAMDTDFVSSPWDSLLCTGGADGMVHVFSHIDLVEQSSTSSGNSRIQPIRSWTKHNLAVTALIALNGGRMASGGEDGQIVCMDLSSGSTIATIQLPDAVRALTIDSHHGRRLFAGNVKGTIHIIDLDAFAVHQTVQMGANIVNVPKHMVPLEDQIFGTLAGSPTALDKQPVLFQSELRGHDRSITALAVFDDDDESSAASTECLVSGDESGVIRIWDSRRGCCVRVIYPWSQQQSTVGETPALGNSDLNGSASARLHPVTELCLVRDESNPFEKLSFDDSASNMFGTKNADKRKRMLNFASMVAPLQKFSNSLDGTSSSSIPVPFVQPRINEGSWHWNLSAGEEVLHTALQTYKRKRQRKSDSPKTEMDVTSTINGDAELERLQQELKEAKETIARWESVNNKLLQKIKASQE
jgi:WD40 repeat protein